MFYVYIFIVVVNLFSDQSMERQTEPGTIYIGNTELTNSLDLDRIPDILSREKTQLQIQNYRLQHQNLELTNENTGIGFIFSYFSIAYVILKRSTHINNRKNI
jgi:hypothetical protein